jgi:hypothetical protein
MNIEALIAAKKAQRIEAGQSFRITFDKRTPFNYFAKSKQDFERQYARAVASIGKRDASGMTALTVEVM